MRLTLRNPKKQEFQAGRWCFRGSVDRRGDLYGSGSTGPLAALVERFGRHIGQVSFYELM